MGRNIIRSNYNSKARNTSRSFRIKNKREIKHIATSTYPQPWGWTTPSSSWRAPGWWRWPPVMARPSDRVPKQGPGWFLVPIEACGCGTLDLGFFSGVSVFIEIFGIGSTSEGSPSQPRVRGHAQGGRVRPPPSWMTRDSSGQTLLLRGLLLVHKKSSGIFSLFGPRLIFLFCITQKTRKKQKLALGSRLIG